MDRGWGNHAAARQQHVTRGLSYQELLDTDTRKVPEVLRLHNPTDLGSRDIPVVRYTTREFHELEVERLWKRVWQMACREEDIPEVGDTIVYAIAHLSILIVRSDTDTIKAFYNACLHRGRLLREDAGFANEIRCPFHGYCWNLDGSLKQIPAEWDFPHVDREEMHLPEVKVGAWGGFVFINLDPECAPLDAFLGDLSDHFARWPLEQRYKQAHVAKVLRCNWKVAQEAFMEAFHVVATHPQLLPGIGDANSQYDVFGSFSRAITANGTPSPHLSWTPTEQERFDAMTDRRLDEPPLLELPDGMTARQAAAMGARTSLAPIIGKAAAEDLSDAELVDSFYYTVFPNFHPWGAYNRITYRFRPNGDRHDESIMECMYLAPFVGERPPSAPVHWLGPDDDWTLAPELGFLARVFNQDTYNLAKVQQGLRTTVKPGVTLSLYQELKIRHFHQLLDEQLGLAD
jgi:phenylpropionate dioxygenase-like ring-hydroxylating dioxygenase large terminal subunit